MSLMTWVPGLLLFCLQGYLEGGWTGWRDNSSIAAGLFFGAWVWILVLVAAGAGAFGLGEMEARGRRADVRRLLRGRRIRRGHQRRAAHRWGYLLNIST